MTRPARSAEADVAFARAIHGRGFGPAGAGGPPVAVPPPPRALQDGEVDLGRMLSGDVVGLHLGKLLHGRLLIQGNSGAGKSMLLRRLFEQAFGRVQQLLIDPDGEFATLAENFDVAVLDAAAILRVGAAAFASHLREHRYSAVLDLSDAKAEEQMTAIADLIGGLVESPPDRWHPMLVLVDEAQRFAPHYDHGDVTPDTRKRAIAALSDMMGRGRKRGLAGVIATQRIAETSKAVLAKATNIIVGRTTFDVDLERAGKLLGFTAGAARPLRSLKDGEFLGTGPAIGGAARVRFKAGPAISRHKGAAPEIAAPPEIGAAAAAALIGQMPTAAPAPASPGHVASGPRNVPSRVWTEPEEAIVRDGYAANATLMQISQNLVAAGFGRRGGPAICMRARALGLASSSRSAHNDWTDPEDDILRKGYANRDAKIMDIVAMLAGAGFDRGRVSVQMRAIALGVTRDRVNYWTDAETRIAKEGLEAGKTNREIIADLLDAGFERGVTAVSKFAQKHGYDRSTEGWTAEQLELLRQRYADKVPVKDIADELGKPVTGVRAKASNLGLKMRTGWTDAERKMLLDAEAAGERLVDVAERIGRPYPNVARMAATLQLDFRQGRKKSAA